MSFEFWGCHNLVRVWQEEKVLLPRQKRSRVAVNVFFFFSFLIFWQKCAAVLHFWSNNILIFPASLYLRLAMISPCCTAVGTSVSKGSQETPFDIIAPPSFFRQVLCGFSCPDTKLWVCLLPAWARWSQVGGYLNDLVCRDNGILFLRSSLPPYLLNGLWTRQQKKKRGRGIGIGRFPAKGQWDANCREINKPSSCTSPLPLNHICY